MIPIAKSLAQLNVAVLLLGGTTLFAKLISLPAQTITLYRALIGFISLALFIKLSKTDFRLKSGNDYFLIGIAGILVGFHWVTFFHSVQISSVAVGILSLYTFPVITTFLEPLIERQPIRMGGIAKALIIFIGILLMIPEFEVSNRITMGVIWGVISASVFSLRNIMVRKKLGHIPGTVTMAYQLFIIFFMLLPFSSFSWNLNVDNRLILLFVLGIIFTAVPHVLMVSSFRNLTISTASLIMCLHPFYSIIFAFILLAELPEIHVVTGGIIVTSVALYEGIRVSLKKKLKRSHHEICISHDSTT